MGGDSAEHEKEAQTYRTWYQKRRLRVLTTAGAYIRMRNLCRDVLSR